ncbi:MAG: abortive infection system antitoxin AbiGi family protein [Acidimicrobiia bacterium]
MTFGYQGKPHWRDMSDYLVHLTESTDRLLSIVENHWIAPAFLGAVAKHPHREKLPDQTSCCLSEIPLDHLGRLADRHGWYGVGFSKDFIRSRSGTRVWYLDDEVELAKWLFESRRTGWFMEPDPADPIWRLTPFIDYVTSNHHFEWEREWRVLGGLSFESANVGFLFGPEGEHVDLLARLDLTVPIVDPSWDDPDQVQAAFAPLPPGGT